MGEPRGEYAKTAARKRAIVDAATSVFSQRGYHGGSLRDISKQLGISLAGIMHHFPTKSELLQEVLACADERARTSLTQADAKGRSLEAWVLDTVRANLKRPEMLRMLAIVAAEASASDHPAHVWFIQRYANMIDMFTERIVRDQAAGLIRTDRTATELARVLVGLWDGLQLQWLLDTSVDIVGLMTIALEQELRTPATAQAG